MCCSFRISILRTYRCRIVLGRGCSRRTRGRIRSGHRIRRRCRRRIRSCISSKRSNRGNIRSTRMAIVRCIFSRITNSRSTRRDNTFGLLFV